MLFNQRAYCIVKMTTVLDSLRRLAFSFPVYIKATVSLTNTTWKKVLMTPLVIASSNQNAINNV